MIPENIKKLLNSDNKEDRTIGFSLAKTQGLEDNLEFRRYCYQHVRYITDNMVDRDFNYHGTVRIRENKELDPYKYFRILV